MFSILTPKVRSIWEASNEERHEAIEKLIGSSKFKNGYYLLLILSVLIVTPGLLINNTAVIIGGMVMAPLLVPILLFSLSIVSGSGRGMIHALRVLILSLVIVLLLSSVLTWLLSATSHVVLWIPDRIPTDIYFLIAFCSGTAAALAWVKESLAPTVAGIAITVSLLPPLCAVGIALSLSDIELATNSFLLFMSNIAGIILSAVLVFLILGFLSSAKDEEKALEKE